jgi:hypothetical protein
MIRYIALIYGLITAVMAAIGLDIVVHFGFGIAASAIRTDALVGIVFVGVALVGSNLLARNK